MPGTRLHHLADHDQNVWIDFLSRDLVRSGELARMMREDGVSGVTSNPTIFARALSGGDAYDEQIAASAGDARRISLDLAMRDVSDAGDLLRPVWERTENGDGYVSIEVDPTSSSRASTPRPTAASPRRVDEDLEGGLGIANAKLAYQQCKALFQGERWYELAVRGASPQRCLWASTSVKDPSRRDTLYVEELIGPQTISTMPEATIHTFQDHGRVEPRRESDSDEAERLFDQLAAAGVDYDDVVATLEREGIEKFVASIDELLERVDEKRRRLAAA